jgi:hypothetical protein
MVETNGRAIVPQKRHGSRPRCGDVGSALSNDETLERVASIVHCRTHEIIRVPSGNVGDLADRMPRRENSVQCIILRKIDARSA